MRANPTLSVSIVTHNNESVIEKCLLSLLRFWPQGLSGEIHIVDHLSQDQTVSIVERLIAGAPERAGPTLYLHEPRANPGFGAGHNRVLREAQSDFHCVCNPDIEFTQNVFDALLKKLAEQDRLGQICCKVLFPDGRLQSLNKRQPTLWDLFLRRFLPRPMRAFFKSRLDHYEMLDEGYDHEYSVPFVSGAFFVSPTSLLQKINGFDERYFLYFEDADLSRQILQLGYNTLYTPEVSLIHAWARGAHRNRKLMFIFIQSAFRYFRKWGWSLR
jgi:GT2 family glycosyltransferase